MKISGNTFVITGGAGGIGGAVARDLVSRGANVALFDVVPEEKGREVAASINEKHALYIRVDITSSENTQQAVQKTVDTFGNLVGLVHCAGIAIKREWSNKISDSIDNFSKMLDVNTRGTFIVGAHVADAINAQYESKKTVSNGVNGSSAPNSVPQTPTAEQARLLQSSGDNGYADPHALDNEGSRFFTTDEERGIIINFASVAGHDLYARTLSYGPTKAAVLALTKSFSDFLGPSGIRVNSISPSIVKSGMTNAFSTYFQEQLTMTATFPRRPAEPSDIISTIVYLIESQFVNGQDIRVDGGWRLVTIKPSNGAAGADPREMAPGLE